MLIEPSSTPKVSDVSPVVRPDRARRGDAVVALLIGLVAFAIYNANMRAVTAADNYAARYLPFSILRHHSFLLDPIVDTVGQGRATPSLDNEAGTAYWIRKARGGHYVSKYPIVIPVLLAPLYELTMHQLGPRGTDPPIFDRVARVMEKLCASFIAAASVALMYILLRRRADPGLAALLSGIYAVGTTTWVVSSQALWPHGLGQLLIVATMCLITGPRTAIRVALAGFLCALIAANRQPDTILAAALGLYGMWWAGRSIPLFLAAGVLPIVLTVAYNLLLVGHIAGAYALDIPKSQNFWRNGVIGPILGMLVSPTRGLFVFSPFLLFVPCLYPLTLRDRNARVLTLAMTAAMAIQITGYAAVDWRQGISWGPRWLTDLVPMLIWMLPPIVTSLSRLGRTVFAATCGVSVVIQAIGAFWYTGVTDTMLFAAQGPDLARPMWQVRNAAFIAELAHPPAPADLLRLVQGNLDLIAFVDNTDGTGRQIEMAGWALADRRTPAGVAVFVDGREATGTGAFFVRPDVVRTMGVESPAGWRVVFPADHIEPGKHDVAILVRADTGGEPRLLLTRDFTVPPNDTRRRALAAAAARAAERLAAHQQASGYWLTTYTADPRFAAPRPEMNTYLVAMLIDMIEPVADTTGLRPAVAKARAFLTSQIEPDGLVRYHGRPDALTIGTLGCAITPDTDDTALVWRVAPGPDRDVLARAMETMRHYRRSDGLYRTWLAAPKDYACLDPGKDPNPADFGIQMHLLMLLARENPPEATALCQALQGHTDDPAVWVYYADAPLVPVIRLADLQRAGCPLLLPAARMRTTILNQDVWLRAAQALRQLDGADPGPELHATTDDLLLRLAARDFASVADAPPLLYHNDTSAHVPRYYWSEDFGYALWLRLYTANEALRRRADR